MKTTYFIEKEIAISIVNDDYSGMSDDEISLCEKFIEEHPNIILNDKYEFTKCELTHLYAECIECVCGDV